MCISFANFWLEIVLLSIVDVSGVSKVSDSPRVTAPPEDLSKNYKPLKHFHVYIHHISDF